LWYTFTVKLFLLLKEKEKKMNNKKGGFGAKLLLVLILMIASAVGGAYGYRVLDGKMAARDAVKAIENVDISDYDTAEQGVIQGYIDGAKKDIETAKTRKEVYEVMGDFIADVDKVQTLNEKKLEQALREAEEAKQRYGTNNQTTDQSGNYSNDTNNTTTDDNGYTGDNLTTPSTDDEESSGGFLNSLIGGLANGDN
jgi:succinate dehydrogenase/fumarate reductase flavoprotein subunit